MKLIELYLMLNLLFEAFAIYIMFSVHKDYTI